jgi:hypothetical protein
VLKRVTVCLLLSVTGLVSQDLPEGILPPGGEPPARVRRLAVAELSITFPPAGFELTNVGSPGFCNPVLMRRPAVPPLAPSLETIFAGTRSQQLKERVEEGIEDGFRSLAIGPDDETM